MPPKCRKSAVRSSPQLWKRVVEQVRKSDKGAPKNKWSARKSQLAVQKYKSLGGKYIGKKSPCNSLSKWTKEDWNYISPKRKSGRYLPRKVRERLSPAQKRSENRRKGSKHGQHVKYGQAVVKLMHKTGVIKPNVKK